MNRGSHRVERQTKAQSPQPAERAARSMAKPIRVLVADDHPIVRRGVRSVLDSDSRWTVCGEAANAAEAIEAAKRLLPEVIVLDLALPDANGVEATRQILSFAPNVKILIFTLH